MTCDYKRIAGFLELELKVFPVTLRWLKENLPQFDLFQANFAEVQGFEQAHVMHDGCDGSDSTSQAFYNYNKLGANPLIIERKEKYGRILRT